MSCLNPATGANTSVWYIQEVDCNVTPDNPAWKPWSMTGGIPQLTREALTSATLSGNREMSAFRLSNKQASGETNVEITFGAQDDFIEAASQSTWVVGAVDSDVELTFAAADKSLTRADGDFTTNINVGDFIKVSTATLGGNNKPLYVTAVEATKLTFGLCKDGQIVDETITADVKVNDTLVVGNTRRTFSILVHYQDLDDGNGGYDLITGVEITGQSYEIGVNAYVTGTFPMIGRGYKTNVNLPAGSTFLPKNENRPFTGLDGRVIQDGYTLGFVTSVTPSQDNTANAIFEIGNDGVAAIEYGRANNTFTISTYFYDYALMDKFVNEEETSAIFAVSLDGNLLAWDYQTFLYSSGAPSIEGEGSITVEMSAQSYAKGDKPSLIMRRI